jgi:hypothetical protein
MGGVMYTGWMPIPGIAEVEDAKERLMGIKVHKKI